MTAIERAYQLARSGKYANFTQIKKAMRREFNVDQDLAGPLSATRLTQLCHEARRTAGSGLGLGDMEHCG